MSTSLSSRAAALAVAAVLGASGLVAATSTPAAAVDATYTCTTPLGTYALPVSVPTPPLPALEAGQAVPGGLPVSAVLAIPPTLIAAIDGILPGTLTGLSGTVSDLGVTLGTATIPLGLSAPVTSLTQAVAGLLATGTTGGFTAPSLPGSYELLLPSSFTLSPTAVSDLLGTPVSTPLPAVTCALPAGTTRPSAGTVIVKPPATPAPKLASSIKAKVVKNFTPRPRIRVVVRNAAGAPVTGTVVATKRKVKVGKATLSSAGKAVIRLKARKLRTGKNRVKVTYSGNATTLPSKKVVRVFVRR